MHIYLFDLEHKKNVKLELAVEYTTATTDVFVVFINKELETQYTNNTGLKTYDEYYFKKISHIVGANTQYEGHKYSLTIGFYLDNSELVPFLIDQRGSNDYNKFDTSPIHNEQYFSSFKLFNYKEYLELTYLLKQETLSFHEYINKLINNQLDKSQLTVFNPNPEAGNNFHDFIDYKKFETITGNL